MFKCELCDKELKTKAAKGAHKKLVHKVSPDAGSSFEIKDPDSVKVIGRVKEPTLGDANFDPFKKFKTDEDHYYYRAINTRPHNVRLREAQGFELITGSEYGDLVLGRMKKDVKESLDDKEAKKIQSMKTAPAQQFKQIAEAGGVKTFDTDGSGKEIK